MANIPNYGPVDESGRPLYQSAPSKVGTLATIAGVGTKLLNLSPGAGFLVSGAISVVGSILGSLFKKREPQPLTPEQKLLQEQVKFYRQLGTNTSKARSIASAITGKPIDYWNGNKIGYDRIGDAINADTYGISRAGRMTYDVSPTVNTETPQYERAEGRKS